MGLPDSYRLPDGYNEAYHLTGDGVAVPVVRYLSEHLIEPILDASHSAEKEDHGEKIRRNTVSA
jgi:DNA (cytosine-5)-methyltransferase 1